MDAWAYVSLFCSFSLTSCRWFVSIFMWTASLSLLCMLYVLACTSLSLSQSESDSSHVPSTIVALLCSYHMCGMSSIYIGYCCVSWWICLLRVCVSGLPLFGSVLVDFCVSLPSRCSVICIGWYLCRLCYMDGRVGDGRLLKTTCDEHTRLILTVINNRLAWAIRKDRIDTKWAQKESNCISKNVHQPHMRMIQNLVFNQVRAKGPYSPKLQM